MKKYNLILFVLLVLFSISFIFLASATTFQDLIQGDFDNGTYDFVFYNTSGFVQLNISNSSGNFTSQIFNAGSSSTWNNISWTSGGIGELPANQLDEIASNTWPSTNVNMTGNILLMHMNEASGTIVDYSGLGNNGTGVGDPTYGVAGKINTAMSFEGGNEGINLGNNAILNPSAAMTLSAWIYLDGSDTTYGVILSRWNNGNAYFIGTLPNSLAVVIYFSGGLRYTTPALPSGEWVHFLVTNDGAGNTVSYYQNGEYIGGGVSGGAISSSTSPSSIGYDVERVNYPFKGDIDELAIWNRTLSTSEITDIYKRGALKLNLSVQSCNDAACSGESWTNLGNNLTSPQTFNYPNNTYFQYKFEFDTDNASYSPELYNVSLDYTLLDSTPPDITLNTPANNTNTSLQTIEFNFTATENTAGNINCSLYIDNVFQVENATTSNNTLTNLTATSIAEGSHNWSVNCTDAAANQNQSEQRTFYVDLSPPTASSISYAPGSEGDIDPSTNIEINATISDSIVSVDTVILQYYNGTDWINTTMINSTASVYNVTITTLPADANYTFNIWKNDSFGNANSSTNQTFNSTYDCTWTATSDLGAITGWDENKWVGNITINNTGDAAYSDNNCSLSFHLVHDLTTGRVYFNDWGLNSAYNYYDTSLVLAKANLTITINSTFLSEVKQENAIITLTDSYSRSSTSSQNTTLTLVSNQAGPYLYQLITSPDSSLSIDLTPQNISLESYLRNLMGSTTVNENNTAYNITFNWTLPTDFLKSEGNGTLSYINISDNSLNYNYINITFNETNLPSLSAGTQTIYLYASGVNISGDVITNADNVSLLNEQLNITFSCYATSDGIYVTDCGELDGDYVAPAAAAGSGGGGGGGGGATAQSVSTSADFQLIRGDENKVKVSFKNTEENKSITEITFSVTGKIAKYIKIVPETLSSLDPGEEIDITFEITSPTYIDLGKQEIIITLNGKKGSLKYSNAKKVILEIHELSGNKAHELLNKSAELIQQLNQANLSYPYLDEILNQSLQEIESFNYEIVRDNYKIIEEQVNAALKTKNIIEELTGLLETAKAKGINTDYSERLIKLASLSLERREFSQAYKRAKDSQSVYALEVKGEFGKISYYLKNYPEQISLGFLFLALFSFSTYKVGRLQVIKRKIKKLHQEEILLNQLMTAVQEDCFKKNKMSMDEYKTAMEQYQDKLSRVIEKLIYLENQRIHALKFTSKNKKLKRERENIIKLITELQDDYLKKKKIETRSYELKLLSYNKRLGEIDEMIAMLEAKKAFKRGLQFWKSPKVPKKGKLK